MHAYNNLSPSADISNNVLKHLSSLVVMSFRDVYYGISRGVTRALIGGGVNFSLPEQLISFEINLENTRLDKYVKSINDATSSVCPQLIVIILQKTYHSLIVFL